MFSAVRPLKRWTKILVWVFLLVSLLACGKKANPVIPVKVSPQGVESLNYQIKGNSLIISWSIPSLNTDGSPLTDLKGFSVRKGEWPTKNYCDTCPDQFQETLWIDLKGPELPDIRVEPDQVQLTLNRPTPGYTYFFQVTAVTRKEAASKPSKTLHLSWELPLKPPSAIQFKPEPQGLGISWNPSLSLIDGSAPEGLAGYTLERKTEKGPWQKVNPEPITGTSHTDSGLQEGVNYSYRLKALRSIQGGLLESETSEEKSIVYTSAFPPPAVQDLIAFLRPQGVELRWQETGGSAPSGYYIYRRTRNERTPKRITTESVRETIFEDRQVKPGTTYFYSISAVGSAPALLEGPRSNEIEITYSP
ncbi:MAG: fibronectin type III domain-containing protein [Deltaproteobacteria bacterium]|nr:fibronectin type III domain-containing protein [Deltaproteobacteria bacterium]